MTTVAPVSDRRINVNVSIPIGTGSLQRRLKRNTQLALVALKLATVMVLNPPKSMVRKLLDIPFTTLGIACVDFAAFHLPHGWGWLVTGVSLIVLEFMVAEGDGS